MLEIGDTAPDFELPDQDDAPISLATLNGRNVVLFFYPKDDSTGCTREAAEFSAAKSDFEALGCTLLGLSPDSVARHEKFRAKHGLTVTLLADPERQAIEAYDVWKQKKLYGREYFGVERTTFLIDGTGKIALIWRKVRVPGHVEEVLQAARKLAHR